MELLVRVRLALLLASAIILTAVVGVACGGGGEEDETATPPQATAPSEPTTAPEPTAAAEPTTAEAEDEGEEEQGPTIALDAASATITVDGDDSDWADIEGAEFDIEQIEVPPGSDIEFDPVAPKDATLKVASDGTNVYVLVEVDDTYDYVADDPHLSAAIAMMFRIDDPAPPHMGAEESDLDTSLGMVDIWHWELDCGPGETSGGQGIAGGDDPTCNLDDEFSTTPEDREDDGGGDIANPNAENGLTGAWTHTATAPGGEGKWIFEMSRPLSTGDPQDAQLTSGGTANMAIAYWDPEESETGWSDAGHLQSAEHGWIEVTLP
jgi:hypothetical protein